MAQVRECSRCHEPAVVVVRDWKGNSMLTGHPPGVARRDYACQSCGLRIRLGSAFTAVLLCVFFAMPVVSIAGLCMWGAAVSALEGELFAAMIASGVSVALFASSAVVLTLTLLPRWHMWRSPVVLDAPMPELRFANADPRRRCVCGSEGVCTSAIDRRVRGIPVGVERDYACSSCRRTWTMESAWGLLVGMVGAVAFGTVGMMGLSYLGVSFDIATAGLLGAVLIAAFNTYTTARGAVNLVRHPIIDERRT